MINAIRSVSHLDSVRENNQNLKKWKKKSWFYLKLISLNFRYNIDGIWEQFDPNFFGMPPKHSHNKLHQNMRISCEISKVLRLAITFGTKTENENHSLSTSHWTCFFGTGSKTCKSCLLINKNKPLEVKVMKKKFKTLLPKFRVWPSNPNAVWYTFLSDA